MISTPDAASRSTRWRFVLWGGAALLLLLPLVAMQFTREMNWSPGDFAIFGGMLVAACGAYELVARITGKARYRAIGALVVAAAFLLVWAELAVGIFS